MSTLVAMTFPGLVILLIVAGTIEVVLSRKRRRRGERTQSVVAETGFDVLGLALAPSHKHKQEHDEFMTLRREEEGDAAPPRTTVDLDAGVARIVLPPQP